MSLKSIDHAKIEEFKDQMEACMSELVKRIATAIRQTAKHGAIDYKYGQFSDFFEKFKKRYIVTKIAWEDKEGKLFFLFSFELSIVLAAFISGQPSTSISEMVRKKGFGKEFFEIFDKVSNHLCVGLNKNFSTNIDSNIKLLLEKTDVLMEDGSKNRELIDKGGYLFVTVPVSIGKLDSFPMIFMVNESLLFDLYAVYLEEDAKKPRPVYKIDVTEGFDKVMAKHIMDNAYPVADVSMTLGEAYGLMLEKEIDYLPVTEDGRVVKMVSINDIKIIRSIFAEVSEQAERISRLMCQTLGDINVGQKLISARPSDQIKVVFQHMLRYKIHAIPILNAGGSFAGMITTRMVLNSMSKE